MLCTVEDVTLEGAFKTNEQLEKLITYKIKNMSEYIHLKCVKDFKDVKVGFYARMACVYGVLAWLESKKLIPASSVVSVREGNVSITYQGPLDTGDTQPLSYTESYDYYMNFLLPLPPIGAQK